MNPDLLLAAQHGWKIFPLVHGSRFAVWQPLLRHASSNQTQIEQWENEHPECNWAVATGKDSEVFAVTFSLDAGFATMRELGEYYPGISRTLQARGPHELLAFLEWPTSGLTTFLRGMMAPGIRLRGEEDYVPIPGPGMNLHRRYEYVDREAAILPASEWLQERIRETASRSGQARILAFEPLSNTAQPVLLCFERKNNRWLCDFYESSGAAKIRETLTYRFSETVVSLANRGGAITDYESRARLYREIEIGHGCILLNLTSDQYSRLVAA